MTPRQKPTTGQKGRRFEQEAERFLVAEGYRILERNWRASHKEIDLIAVRDRTIVFVEVKGSTGEEFGHPSERVDRKKRENLIAAAEQFIIDKNLQGYDYRFDLITFQNNKLEYYPDAFRREE